MAEYNGIAVAGNILTDNVKLISLFPEKGTLVTIESESLAVGGCVPNTGIDLKKLDKDLPVRAYGMVGNDYKGEFVVNKMKSFGLNTEGIVVSEDVSTSYSDVMTITGTGERTFFHNRGANKMFSPADIDIDKLDCKIFHIGYLMLLDSFDIVRSDGTTPMSEMLKKIQAKGIKTSIDLVTENKGNFNKVVSASLPYCNYVIINEIEAGNIVGISPRNENGIIDDKKVEKIMRQLFKLGIKDKIIVHCPEKGYALDKNGVFTVVESAKLPKNFIKGSVGAGDAFCAGSLYALYNNYSDTKLLKFSNYVAINCLSAPDSVSGVVCKDKIKDVLNKF